MTFQKRMQDSTWLARKAHPVSLYLTAKAMGQGGGEAWQKFKAENANKTHFELCVLQGLKPSKQAVKVTSVVDNRTPMPEMSNFLATFRKEMTSFKKDIKSFVRKEIARQLV